MSIKTITMNFSSRILIWVIGAALLGACGGKPGDPETKRKELEKLKSEKAKIELAIAALEKELGTANDSSSAEKPAEVKVISPRTGIFETFAEFQGVVVSEENLNLGSEVGGRITKIMVKEGQEVSKGQVLATFDSELIQKSIEEVQNALDLATVTYEKQKNLWDQKIGSEIQFLQAKNQKENLEKKMETLKAQANKTLLRSPIQGTVDKIYLNSGEMAGPGVPVMRVVNNREIKITADIPERFVGKLKKADSVGITLPAIEKTISGKIRSVGQVIDVNNRTFNLIVDPTGKKEKEYLKPNMLAVVKAVIYRNKKSVSVPTDIIRFENNNKYVYAAVDGKARKITVETGESSQGYTEILSGLGGTEQIISRGLKSVSEGTVLTIIGSNP
jgi:RND family efflux transporter MFP subunit